MSLTGCGSTIVTRIYSRDVLDHSRIGQSARQAWQIGKRAGITLPGSRILVETAQGLESWARDDSERLALAAEAFLDMRPRGQDTRQGFALAALQLAYRSLQTSGVPAPRWLTTQATRKTISVYNAALDRFVSLSAEELARGIFD